MPEIDELRTRLWLRTKPGDDAEVDAALWRLFGNQE
jgi:hypothetical protein